MNNYIHNIVYSNVLIVIINVILALFIYIYSTY